MILNLSAREKETATGGEIEREGGSQKEEERRGRIKGKNEREREGGM